MLIEICAEQGMNYSPAFPPLAIPFAFTSRLLKDRHDADADADTDADADAYSCECDICEADLCPS